MLKPDDLHEDMCVDEIRPATTDTVPRAQDIDNQFKYRMEHPFVHRMDHLIEFTTHLYVSNSSYIKE
jgi:hypothetical protein